MLLKRLNTMSLLIILVLQKLITFSNLVEKTEYNIKISAIENKKNYHGHVLAENEFNELLKKSEAIAKKRLTKELKNGYKILYEERHLSSRKLQNYKIHVSNKKYFRSFTIHI